MINRGNPFFPRHFARECAVAALYVAEFAKLSMRAALAEAFEVFEDPEFRAEIMPNADEPRPEGDRMQERFLAYTRLLAEGVWRDKGGLDEWIGAAIPDYDLDRLAAIDRSILRVAAWEIREIGYVPPAVSINEAVEMAKKYSTAESGRFVNGVLATLLKSTLKANWNPADAPPDPDGMQREEPYREVRKVEEPIVVQEGTPEAKIASRHGVWQIGGDR